MIRNSRILVVALIVISGGGTGLGVAADMGPLDATETPREDVEPLVTQDDNATASVTLENQSSGGITVVVEEAVVPEGGFAAIYSVSPDSDPPDDITAGVLLGNTSYLEAGTHENLSVELNGTLIEDQYMIAVVHSDTNDDQLFTYPESDDTYEGDQARDIGFVTFERSADPWGGDN